MRLRNFYNQGNYSGKEKKGRTIYAAMLFVALFLFGSSTISRAAFPTFTGPNPASYSVCMNSGPGDFSHLVTVNDPDAGDGLIWSAGTLPAHGILVAVYSVTATGGDMMPVGLTYTPDFGYSGNDMFSVNVFDGTTNITMIVNVLVAPMPGIVLGGNPAVCHGATSTEINFSNTTTYGFTGSSNTYVVPAGVTSINFDIMGAAGGNDTSAMPMPGRGGRLQGTMTVNPGDVLNLTAGGMGETGTIVGAPGGFNGGGISFGYGGSGGGSSDIRYPGTSLLDRVAVAGGGGGSGYMGSFPVFGGNGGGLTGAASGENPDASVAGGGTQTAGGAGATFTGALTATDGMLYAGGDGSTDGVSGGGGGGFYGGGGGLWTGGGGGSSYTDGTLVSGVVHTQGFNTGNGQINISYPVPGTYSYNITWDAPALAAGFTNVPPTSFPSTTSFPITIPTTAGPDIYNGTVTINDGVCSYTESFTVTVKAVPDVNATSDQAALCNGEMTSDVMFTGSVPGTNYNWTNDNSSIGLASSGTGDIMSFTANNGTSTNQVATITVTPELAGCEGPADVFSYTVKPTPTLGVTAAGYLCNNTTFNYTATSAVTGTTFAWSRDAMAGGIVAAPASGTNTISESFNNTSTDPISVVYTFTLTANGCTNTQFVTVTINPTPVYALAPLGGTACSGDNITFVQNSSTTGVTHSWSRASVAGITPTGPTSGMGEVSEVLTNTTPDPITVVYIDTMHINGCTNTQALTVTVNPMPTLTSSVTGNICNNATFNYTATSATAGTTFSWERFVTPGVSSTYASDMTNTVSETHTNTTDNPVVITYNFSLSANGCTNMQNVLVTVNPTPMLNTTLTPASVCDSTFFNYAPGSNTTGATFAWSRATVANISNPANSGTGIINERLRNTATFPVAVTYVVTSSINGCTNAQNVVVTVNPRPRLTNTPLNPKICDSTIFSFIPTSATTGFTSAWERPFVGGIGALPNSGTGNISELLKNNTNANVDVDYIYTLAANGCSRAETLKVTVHPTPKMTSHLTDSACSGAPYIYTPTTNIIPPVTYAWTRAAVANITPLAGSGNGGINETLVNGSTNTLSVTYVYSITVGAACTKTHNLSVKVRPTAEMPVMTTMPPSSLCNGTMYQNFGAAPAAAGNSYAWSATGAEIYATGAGNQYALVNFNTTGLAEVKLMGTIGTTGCVGVATYTVNVTSANSLSPKVIYTNGTFICLQNNVKNFQWGYDDATTLDSTILTGEKNQSYFLSATSFLTRHYWVMTTSNEGCVQKAYFNAPLDNTPRVVTNLDESAMSIKVFPNPASENVNVEVATLAQGTVEVQLVNMLGQVQNTVNADNNKASISVSNLPAGIYMIDCYQGGMKIGTAKFVKN